MSPRSWTSNQRAASSGGVKRLNLTQAGQQQVVQERVWGVVFDRMVYQIGQIQAVREAGQVLPQMR